MAQEIDWELQERGLAVLRTATSTFGERRFASGEIHVTPRPTINLYAVDPTQTEIDTLDRAAEEAGFGLTVTGVRYSHAELVALYERLSKQDLPGDACVSYGFDASINGLAYILTRLDDELESDVRERLPADVVRFIVEPRAPRALAF